MSVVLADYKLGVVMERHLTKYDGCCVMCTYRHPPRFGYLRQQNWKSQDGRFGHISRGISPCIGETKRPMQELEGQW